MVLTKEEMDFIEEQTQQMNIAKAQADYGQVQQMQQAMVQEEQQMGMVKEQLNLGEELIMIENLLRGNIQKPDKNGILVWTAPTDNEMIILSEHGVHLIMNTISFYLKKNEIFYIL